MTSEESDATSEKHGLVAAGHERVVAAAGEVLEAGGNAFDAAVAAGFASAVAEPGLTSLGGGGFLLGRSADGQARVFDFFVDTPGRGHDEPEREPRLEAVTVRFPASEQEFHVGPGSVATPGAVAGYLAVHRRLGRLALEDVIAPAIRLAREGIVVSAQQAYFFSLLEPILTMHAEGRALFAPRGHLLRAGETFTNPALADFISELPTAGAAALYEGSRAAALAAQVDDAGGLLTREDLAGYRVIEREPLEAGYRGCTLLTNPVPSMGGSLLALSLRLLEETLTDGADAQTRAATLVAVMQEVDRLRAAGVLGPDGLTLEALAAGIGRIRASSGGTTHVSVADAEGNVASMTTSNGEGSGTFAPGTGIMLNNMMGEDDLHPQGFHAAPAGSRVASMMSPSVLLEDGHVRLVVGSGGSKRIRTALLQVIAGVVDDDLGPAAAIVRPRVHWDGEIVQMEPGFSDAEVRALGKRWPLNRWPARDVYFGGVHAVAPLSGHTGADPRRGGASAVF
jgi:gamma-glutamyltranspeptidase/glutathione hydrolase